MFKNRHFTTGHEKKFLETSKVLVGKAEKVGKCKIIGRTPSDEMGFIRRCCCSGKLPGYGKAAAKG